MDEDIQLRMRYVSDVLQSVFTALDRRLEERWTTGGYMSHGFWRTGAIPKLMPVDTLREYGFWQAKGDLSTFIVSTSHGGLHLGPADGGSPADDRRPDDSIGLQHASLHGQVSVSLIGGHTRIGIFLPNRLLEGVSPLGESLTDAVSRAHDGQPAPIIRRMGGDTLFDHVFTEAPFSAEWLLRCTRDINAQTVLEHHLAWRVIVIWESTLRAVMSSQAYEPGVIIRSTIPLPVDITETLPLTLQDTYEIQPGYWVTLATPSADEFDVSVMEAQLQALLPGHGITIQGIG
ncbi:MAG: hypothetical protein ACYCSH_01620 [Acidithiobacillus sp.]